MWSKVKGILRPGSPYLFGDIGEGSIPSPTFRFPAPGSQHRFIPQGSPEKEELTGYTFQKKQKAELEFEKIMKDRPYYGWLKIQPLEMNLEKHLDSDGGPAEWIWKARNFDTVSHKLNNPSYTKISEPISEPISEK